MSNNGDEEPFDYPQFKRELDDFIIDHRKGKEAFENVLKTSSTIEDIKEFLTIFTKTYFLDSSIYLYIMRTQIDLIQGLDKALDAMPDREEFDEVRKEMNDFRTKMRKTFRALKDIIDEAKKRADRGDDIYG